MNHLTIEEIIEFISVSEMNADTVKLISRVNTHICRCPKCLELVQAFQVIEDELNASFAKEKLAEIANELALENGTVTAEALNVAVRRKNL